MNEELKVIITADTSDLNKELEKSGDKLEELGDKGQEASDELSSSLADAKAACANAMKAMATAIVGATTAMVALAETTREMRTNQAKLETAFESAGASAETAAKVYDDLYRVLGDDGQATEAAAHLAKLSTNQAELAEWTDICKGVYAEFGDSLPLESLTEAANETAKVGTVTGALADALNWAGVSEDEFNKKLEACNDEAEREKLIRKTLNDVYKKSASNYEKNNKKILDANTAQNKLNKELAKTGDAMEPVSTELKKMGAAVLKDLQKPLSDTAKFLTNTVFPAIKNVYEFIKSNLPTIIAMVSGMAAGYVAYKAAVLASTVATEGLTLAQKALNVVMNANPVGLITGVLAGLTVGLIAYCATTEDSVEITQHLTDEQLALIEASSKAADEFREQVKASEELATSIQAETGHYQKLKDELFLLADEQGRVATNDESRAKFIINELNEAYGLEIEMVDGVILKYGELKGSIEEVMLAKTANALLEAKNEAYVEALQAENDAIQAVVSAEQDMVATQAELDVLAVQKEEAYNKMREAALNGWYDEHKAATESWQEISGKHLAVEESLKQKTDTYNDALADYAIYYETINDYENAAALIQEGNYDKAVDILKGKSQSFFEYADNVDAATQEALDALYKEVIDTGIAAAETKDAFERGVEGYTEQMVAEAESGYKLALAEWSAAYADANGVGEDLSDGLSAGMEDKRSSLLSKARSIVSGIIAAMRSEADSHSPSRKTISFGEDLGAGAEIGIEDSTKNVVKASTNLVRDSLKALEGFGANRLTASISGTITAAAPIAPKNIDSPAISSLLSAIGSQIGSNNTPIIIQVDGKTFASTAINTINANTKQTGKLQLMI